MDNLYRTPSADLLDEQTNTRDAFFVTSQNKLYLLYCITFGLYSIYWFYKQWDSQRSTLLPKKISPAARSIFQIFFTHSLCRLISEQKQRQGQAPWAYSAIAWAYVVLTFFSNGLSRIESQSGAADFLLIAAGVIIPAIPLAVIQQQANQASGDESGQGNSRISARNLLFIVPGALLWLALLVGAFL